MKPITSVISLMTATLLLSGCNDSDSKMVTACETALKERLLAPSLYKRIEIDERKMPTDHGSYEARLVKRGQRDPSFTDEEIKDRLRRFDKGLSNPIVFALFIKYDSPNIYGTPIRYHAVCGYLDDPEDHSEPTQYEVEVNGKTVNEWSESKEARY